MRIRTVKPEFWLDEKLAKCSDFSRLLAIALLNYSDDHGYFNANPVLIRGLCFPFLDSSKIIRGSIQELSNIGYLQIKQVKCSDKSIEEIGFVTNFKKHQRVDKPKPSVLSEKWQFQDESTNDLGLIQDESKMNHVGNGIGMEEEGKGKRNVPATTVTVIPPMLSRLPMWEDTWEKYCQHRSTGKSKFTPLAKEMAVKKLATFRDPIGAMENSIVNGWSGLFDVKEEKKPYHQETADEAVERLMRGG